MKWLVYIDRITKSMSMREVFKKPTQSDHEIFMVITDELTAMTLCNRYNNEIVDSKNFATPA